MSEGQMKVDWPMVAVVVVPVLLLLGAMGLYFGAYFSLQFNDPVFEIDHTWRCYDSPWKPQVFYPAARVESLLTGQPVSLITGDSP